MRDAAEGRGFAEGKPATELHLVGDIFDFGTNTTTWCPKEVPA